jgi:RNA 3'-terminal phosphate cyclase (ATP)
VIRIDGSMHSGSGTLLRYASVLATLVGEPLHMVHIRARREKPGLRPQHLLALRACSSLCSGRLEGDAVGSREIYYYPGPLLKGGDYHWDIGTAGSTTMLAYSVIPLALYAKSPSRFSIVGGLFQDHAPSAFHMQKVLFPFLSRLGVEVRIEVIRPGYVPQGGGELQVSVQPLSRPIGCIRSLDQGRIVAIRGISLASHLEGERVAMRMADRCRELLESQGWAPQIEVQDDASAVQKGAALLLWAQTDTGCLMGADQAGKRGRRSENIAAYVVKSLLEDIGTGATTDRHLADQLILFAALAGERTEYLVPGPSEHVQSNLWLVSEMLGAKAELKGNLLRVDGVGYFP